MENNAALRSRLENLSPEQRTALLQQISRLREQREQQGGQPQGRRPAPGAPYPLSLAQRRLWMLSQLGDEASAAYNIASAFCFDRGLAPERLQRAWRSVLASHEVLRSAFVQQDDELRQIPRDADEWCLQQQALTPETDVESQLVALASAEAGRAFDLHQDWLLRVIYCVADSGQAGLVVIIHHSVCDGLSITNMVAELAQHYAADDPDAGALAESTALQYRDFVDYEARADTRTAKAYWKNIFASAPESLDALLDLPRPVSKDFHGRSVTATLPAPDAAAFESLCHANNATMTMGLVALVQLLLARFANADEVTLGTPVAGRPGAQFDKVIGPFVNTIALRQSVDRKQTFPELLKQVRRRVLEGFQHQGLAFDELVTDLGFAKDPSRSPLYDVMLGYTTADDMALSLSDRDGNGCVGRPLRLPQSYSKVDLTFHIEKDSDGSLRLDLEYATSVFVDATARILCDAWRLLASAIPRQASHPVGELPLQSAADQRLLLEQVNATARPYPKYSSLVEEFCAVAQRSPDAIAVHAGDVQLSYAELDARSWYLAETLQKHPAYQPGCHIALMLEKDERALIVILAILKSHGTYLPLAANTPLQRVRDVLAAGTVPLLFTESELIPAMSQLDVVLLDTDALLAEFGSCAVTALRARDSLLGFRNSAGPGATEASLAPAYLMFTSGSTGKPKGTLIEQCAVLRLVCNTDYHQVRVNERVLLTGSLAFDAATFEIWGALLNGGCVCIPAGTTLLEVHEFHALVEHYRIDTAFLTTGLFNQLVDNSASAFGQLQTVLTGGEKVSVGHVRKILQQQPQLKLLHVYGPTENTTFSTWHRITMDDLALSTIPIGRPIANSRIYLLDPDMRPVPVGVPGEIVCGGDGIARGYLAQQAASGNEQSAVFQPDPFVPEGTGRLYRTGDIAKWNHKRELVFLGRNDRQVKVRGFRVELGEVEHHLRALPGVADAYVQARGETGSSELVAWLVAPVAVSRSVADIREALKGSVPNYMLPARIVHLERLPLNASGKVDVSALPLPDDTDAGDAAAGQLDCQAERDLARLYADVLRLSGNAALAIDRDANFFSLGGDSIRAIQLVSQARAVGYHFTLKDIFASETLAGLAATAVVKPVAANEEALQTGPLSPTQHWWLDQCGPPADHFNLSSVFRVAERIDSNALRKAIEGLIEMYPALRLSLDTDTQQQSIRGAGRYVLRIVEAGQPRQQCWQELQQAIDLRAGILLAVGLAIENDVSYLAVVVHHLAADEVSGRLFARSLERLYRRQVADANSTAQLPIPEALGIINWSAQLQAAVVNGVLDGDLGYWQAIVAQGRQIIEKQQDLFAAEQAHRDSAQLTLSRDGTEALFRLSAGLLRMKPQETLLAAFIRVWQSMLDDAGCVLSLEGHGRETLEGLGDCSSTMGWFTSLYPFVYANDQAQQLDLYREVKDSLRRLPANGFTYLPLRYQSGEEVRRSLSLRPQISFNYLGESAGDTDAWLAPAHEPAGNNHGAAIAEPFKLDVLARTVDGQLELMLHGQAPHQALALAGLASAWLTELRELTVHLQTLSSGVGEDADAGQYLLSRADSLVEFTSLAELDATLAALGLPASGVEEILPLTGMQAGMWLHCTTHPTAYQDQVALRLHQPLDERQFANCVQALIAETQALRTGFAQTAGGDLLQIVFRERRGNYQSLSLDSGAAEQEATLADLRAQLRSVARDLLHDPLFTITLVRIDAECYELIIDFHHMALDGWTSAMLLQRLEALYFGDARGGDRNAASGMRAYFEWLGRQSPAQARDYWQRLLGDYQSRCDVPTHLPRLPATEPTPLFVETRTGVALHASLLAWCEQHGLTLNAAVQTLWGIYLSRLTGSDDLVFGATVSGRDSDLAGIGTIAGMLINTLPVRIQTAGAATFAALVRETAQQFADSMSSGHLTLAEIQTLTPARAGLVTHALVFENYPAADQDAARWHWQPQEIFDPMHFEFGLIVAPLANDLSFRFVADGSLFLQGRLQAMGSELCTLLASLLDGQQTLAALTQDVATGWTVSANFTADSLVGLLQYHEYISGQSAAVTLLPYDQSVQELINPDSRLRRLRPQQHVVLWRPVTDKDGKIVAPAAIGQLTELTSALAAYARTCPGSRLYVVPCPWIECYAQGADWTQYRELTASVAEALAGLHNADVLSMENVADTYSLQQACYPPDLVFGDIPYTEQFFAALANRLARLQDQQRRRAVKVFVVDADDTLWGGIVGEEGIDGIRLDPVHIQLQQQLLDARAAGALICLASKNNEDDVRAVFEQRDMPLRWEHLTRVCAGWQPKSESILTLAEDLSLGLDSFVFIDDSPLECEQVLAACPGVLAIQLPPAQAREAFLNHLWLLDARAATREDTVRARMYAEELQRASARKTSETYGQFLASLDIRVDMHRLAPDELPRTAQLSQRTNQFNTTGFRYTEAELATLRQQPDTDIRCISVTDKYGDYGLTGSVFIRRGDEVWTVFGFMLSCRVLGRGVEHTILRQLAEEAVSEGISELCVDFVKLARNTPALQFLHSVCDAPAERGQGNVDSQFHLPVSDAVHWQPGAGENAVYGERGVAAPMETATDAGRVARAERADNGRELASAPDARGAGQFYARASSYYQQLAGSLNSGAAILHELQRQGAIQQTSGAARTSLTRTLPATPTEVALAGFFTELLGQSDIYREDSFHDLGGHSLKAMMLFSRIAARFGLTLDFRDLQAYPTLAALAARLDDSALNGDAPLAPGPVLQALPDADSYPVSPGQSRLWMLEQLRASGPSPLHMHATLTVGGTINRQALDNALQVLFLRHDSLRTCFREDARGRIRQIVVPIESLSDSCQSGLQAQHEVSPECRVRWFDEVLDEAALDAASQAQSGLAFDLSQAPLLRIAAGALVSGGSALFITMHHIISDGWSMGIFSRELTQLYQAFNAGARPAEIMDERQACRLRFCDFASWQIQWLASEAGNDAVLFWQEHFARPVEPLQLPAAAPRPALMQSAGASVQVDVGPLVWSGFSRQLSGRGITDFSGLLAALQLVLARLSGQTNFCIGTAVAGRQHPQLESMIGFFVNILPVRATLALEDRVDSFMLAVATEVNNCLSHQGVPFDTIVSSLDLVRDPGRTPLFDVLLVLQNTDEEDLRFGEHVAEVRPVASTTSQYDLTISAFPTAGGGLRLLAEYDSVIYSRGNIELILRCLGQTLKGLTGNDSETLLNIPWLCDSDTARVEAFESHASVSTPGDRNPKLLPDLFRSVAAGAKGRISDGDSDWSYAELEQEMQRVASLLLSAHLKDHGGAAANLKQRHVGVIGKRSVRSIAALLGTMAAGAVYIPLDLSNPLDRLLLIIGEGDVDLLLSTDQEGAELANELQLRRQDLCHVRYRDTASEATPAEAVDIQPDAIAYMIFTSGSTGKPKGVQISHAAFLAMIGQQIPVFDVRCSDVCAQFAALSFDASLSEVFLALGSGASLAIAPDTVRSDIDIFMQWLDENAITVITLPPVFLRALDKRNLGPLRVLVTAGDAAIAEDLRHYAKFMRVLNAYGPTETSVCASVYPVDEHDTWRFGVPIGKPLPGVLLSVRDAAGSRVPVGVTGELYIGGSTLGHGYYGLPELTARKFIAQKDVATSGSPSRRWYRSGDLVRWRDDGLLEFTGRVDDQLKVRGYRIEPGEIEHVARQADGVDDALALLHPQLGLLLYCVTGLIQDDRDVLRSALVVALARALPRYMQPAAVMLMDAFPLSSAGKVERSTLLKLATAPERAFVPPTTAAERVLAQTWSRVLGAERVGCGDDFFALGGDSIKALEVLSDLRAAGFTCELKDFFTYPLLQGMACTLLPWHETGEYREPLAGPVALLPVQSWFLRSRSADVARHFHIVTELSVSSSVTQAVLMDAVSGLIRDHDALRARFPVRDGEWLQDIQETLDVVDVVSCYRCAATAGSQADQSAVEERACRPFDLETGPLIRVILVQGPAGDSQSLVLAVHHLVADWVSLRILIADLNALAQDILTGNTALSRSSPPHLLREVASGRGAELSLLSDSASAVFQKAVATTAALAPDCGFHNALQTLHIRVSADELAALRAFLQQQSSNQQIDFRLQDLLLATILSELGELLPVDEIPLLVEGHGRDGSLDLSRQVAWLTRARLLNISARQFTGDDALRNAHQALQPDAGSQPDVFACLAGETEMRNVLPALASFNYLGEFASSQHVDDLFNLTGRVFDKAVASTSPVDVPLQMELYVVDFALEIQVAWSAVVFEPGAMRACWERVRRRFARS